MRSIVMLSGGLKSAVALAHAISLNGLSNVHAVTVTYPNTTARKNAGRRALAAQRIAGYYKVEHTTVGFPSLPSSGQYVPTEPVIIYSMAAHLAHRIRADEVVIASQKKEAADFIFVNNLKATLRMCFAENGPELEFPFLAMPRSQVIRMGADLNVQVPFTYSCETGELIQCGKCRGCAEKRIAFKDAGVRDPIVYAS